MRKALLTLGLVVLLAVPATGQFRFTPTDPTGLLSAKPVQDELKLTDEQKKAINESSEELQKAIIGTLQDKDLPAMLKAQDAHTKAVKKILDKLDDKQKVRLAQIEFQVCSKMKNPRTFANAHVEKELKLTDKQKKTVKETITELDKDFKEYDDDAKDAKTYFTNLLKKGKKNAEAYEKIVEALDDDQKKSMDKVGGDAFDLGGKKDEKKDKKDD